MSGGWGFADPVKRRWLLSRFRGRFPAEAGALVPVEPLDPALAADPLRQAILAAAGTFGTFRPDDDGAGPATLSLPGFNVDIDAAASADPFLNISDEAGEAALQSFHWAQGPKARPLMAALWPLWLARHGKPASGPAWQPAVAAFRLTALIDFAERHGLPGEPGETADVLAAHGSFLLARLAGPARPGAWAHERVAVAQAVARLGYAVGVPALIDAGIGALLAEAARLALPSGMTRLESTGHSLLLAGLYADIWLAALRKGDTRRAAGIERALTPLLGALRALTLPGGLPPVGDVLATRPRDWYRGLPAGGGIEAGWSGQLAEPDQARLAALAAAAPPADLSRLAADGWLRFDTGPWSGLWHGAPGGWSRSGAMGHQDLGAFVLEYRGTALFVDPGGSAFGALDGAGFCHWAHRHGGLTLDEEPPYPADDPAYTEAFRREIGGGVPELRCEFDGVALAMAGFNRLGGPRSVRRRWRFDATAMTLDDAINGTGRYEVARRLFTPLQVTREADAFLLEGEGRRFRLTLDRPATVSPSEGWPGFGTVQRLNMIECAAEVSLPWRGTLRLDVL